MALCIVSVAKVFYHQNKLEINVNYFAIFFYGKIIYINKIQLLEHNMIGKCEKLQEYCNLAIVAPLFHQQLCMYAIVEPGK